MHTRKMAVLTMLLVGVSGATAQSLGEYARTARKSKPEPTTASRHFDNDNLPTDQNLSVVGPPPSADPNGQSSGGGSPLAAVRVAPNVPATGNTPSSSADRQKDAEELKKKLDAKKEKIDALNHELDLDQREYRLRAAAMYGDAGSRLRNAAQWDKDDAQYKKDIAGKQEALQSAKQELEELQEQARKSGVSDKEKEKDNQTDKSPDNDKDK